METGKRYTTLIADFVDGYAHGWYMAVKECYRNELDIKYTERKKHKQSFFEWTQGPYFSFAEGHMFYDTPKAYKKWGEAINDIKIACKIVSATPTICDKNRVSSFSEDEFKGQYSVISLCEVLHKDAVTVVGSTIDGLNKILELADLYEQVRKRHASIIPSQRIVKLQKTFNKSKLRTDLIRLNRAILEKFYEQDSPKSQDKSLVEGIVNFTIYKPDEKHTSLKAVKDYKLSQREFVNFLKTGALNE